MKYVWIDAHREEYELADLCRALAVSVSGYRAWKGGGTPERKRLTDAQMLAGLSEILCVRHTMKLERSMYAEQDEQEEACGGIAAHSERDD